MAGDATLMRYVVFLMQHGKAPYRDIVDINFPGSYLVEWLVMHCPGSGSLAWRLFDLALGLAATIAMLVIAWPWEGFAGLFAGILFILLHGRDGIQEMGQRDLVMAVLLLGAYAALFCFVRRSRGPRIDLTLIALIGTLLGFACTIKPTAVLFIPVLLVLAAIELRRQNRRCLPLLAVGTAFALLPVIAAFLFLVKEHALRPFVDIVVTILPDHADLRRHSLGYLLLHALPGDLLPLLVLWAPLAAVSRFLRTWEGKALLAGVVLGLVSFLAQGKGYSYQRYPAESLLLITIAIDLALAAKAAPLPTPRWARILAVSALAFAIVIGFGCVKKALSFDGRNDEFATLLTGDLNQLGGAPALDGKVQCLDIAAGCLDVLYRARIVQATGFLYDCYLIYPDAADLHYREEFWEEMKKSGPRVIIVTSHKCGLGRMDYTYSELNDWPQLRDYLADHYTLDADRVPPHPVHWSGSPGPPFGYRIYTRQSP